MITSPRLLIASPGGRMRIVELNGATTLGRDIANDIVLEEITVSRYHAVLLARPEGMVLVNLDSTNGIGVNGTLAPPDEPVQLADGDVITLGRVVACYQAPAALRSFSYS